MALCSEAARANEELICNLFLRGLVSRKLVTSILSEGSTFQLCKCYVHSKQMRIPLHLPLLCLLYMCVYWYKRSMRNVLIK